jgi:hypothetical protein
MANPNIINISTLYGKTAVLNVTTVATAIITNSAASGKIVKVNSLFISNIDTLTTAYVTLEIFRSSTSYYIMYQVPVPIASTIDAISKHIYLEEGDQLRISATLNNDLTAVASYEEIT